MLFKIHIVICSQENEGFIVVISSKPARCDRHSWCSGQQLTTRFDRETSGVRKRASPSQLPTDDRIPASSRYQSFAYILIDT